MRQARIHRWLAVLLLLTALMDLSADMFSSQACCEGITNLIGFSSEEVAPSAQLGERVAASISAHESEQKEDTEPSSGDEDCFCCCAHILPGLHFSVAVLGVKPPTSTLSNIELPTAPPQSKFHPPRFS